MSIQFLESLKEFLATKCSINKVFGLRKMSFKQLSSFVARYETAEGDDFNLNQASFEVEAGKF